MAFLSLHAIHGVIDSFLHNTQYMFRTAKEAPDIDDAYEDAKKEVNKAGINYDRNIGRAFGQLLTQAIDLPEDPSKSTFWGDEDVVDLLNKLPYLIPHWTGEAFGKAFAKKLNRSMGSYVYKLFGRSDEDYKKPKTIAWFESGDLNPQEIFKRFAVILNKESKKNYTPETVRENFKYEKKEKPSYDDYDLRTNSTVTAQKALESTVSMLSDELINPSNFINKLAEQRGGKEVAVSWMRPPRGKAPSAKEQTEETDRRKMDPEVADKMFEALESKRPLHWKYVRPEVAPGKGGAAVTMLTVFFPALGDKEYSIVVPNDVGLALRDSRKGEEYTLRVLDYDPSKGFKVSFDGFKDKILLSRRESIRKTGVTAKQLSDAIRDFIDDYASELVKPTISEDVTKVAEQFFGRVIVDGKNVATDQGLSELIDLHEQRKIQRDPRGGKKKDPEDQSEESVLKRYLKEKEELENKRKVQEEGVGEDIAWVQHQRMDHANKAASKIADKISRSPSIPEKGRFTHKSDTWTYANALRSKAGIRWLVELATSEALLPTKTGKIPWDTLINNIMKSDIIGNAEKSVLLGGSSIEKILPALKVAYIAHNASMSDDQKRSAYEEYMKGTLKVNPTERSEISKDLASKEVDYIRTNIVDNVKEEIQRAFINMYAAGDPDIVDIVEVSKARLPERMTEEEKEEWDIDKKKKKVTTTFKTRIDEARERIKNIRDFNSQKARALEDILENGDYGKVRKDLKAVKMSPKALETFEELEKSGKATPDTAEYEGMLSKIETVSDAYERALNDESDKSLEKVFKSVATKQKGKEDTSGVTEKPEDTSEETEELEDKQASLNRLAVKIAFSKMGL
jgi:hypothetical protein